MHRLLPVGVAFAAFCSGFTPAKNDDFDARLPKEKTWAKYHAITKETGGEEKVATLVLKSLGKATVDDKICRWLESEYISSDGKRHERRKILRRNTGSGCTASCLSEWRMR